MKAQEFRIGNWVNLGKDRDGIIKLLSEKSIVIKLPYSTLRTTFDDEGVEPITLTEKWLLKFGFTDLGCNYLGLNEFKLDILFIVREQDEYLFAYENYIGDDYDLEIKYVHQLQNLYFALTGKELILT